MDTRRKLALILALIFLLSFLIYASFEAKKLIYGPQISLSSPQDGETLQGSGEVVVKGTTKNVTFLSLDGRQIFTDTDGNFNEDLVALPGYNIITLSAKGRYGKEISKKIRLYLIKDKTNTFQAVTATSTNVTATDTSATSTQTIFSTSTDRLLSPAGSANGGQATSTQSKKSL